MESKNTYYLVLECIFIFLSAVTWIYGVIIHVDRHKIKVLLRLQDKKMSLKMIEKKLREQLPRFLGGNLICWLLCIEMTASLIIRSSEAATRAKDIQSVQVAQTNDFLQQALTEHANRLMPNRFYHYPVAMETSSLFENTIAVVNVSQQQYIFVDSMIYYLDPFKNQPPTTKQLHFASQNIEFTFFLNLRNIRPKINLLDSSEFCPITSMVDKTFLSQTFQPHKPYFYITDSAYSIRLKKYLYSGVFGAPMPWYNPNIPKGKGWPRLYGTFKGLDLHGM